MRLTARFDGSVRPEDTVVTVIVTDGTTSPEDCLPVPEFTVTILARQVSGTGTFTVTPVDDAFAEDAETLVVRGVVGVEDLGVTPTEITIRDNDESNRPPVFAGPYAFSLQEQQDGRRRPLALGTVEARDPDDDPVEYSLASGDSSRFSVGLGSGEVAYVGPGEDFEAGPTRFELTVAASDVHQGQASVHVVVTVTDVAEAPEAVDDVVELSGDTPTVIDVLANDRDPDGDRLRVASVTTPRQGTAAVAGGGIRYMPRPGYDGEDQFRYTVADPGGLTATATVRVTVLVNRPPQAVDDEAETLEDVPVVVDVLANDTDADGDPLQVISVGPADQGATAIVDGRVHYSPASDWHGTTRFSYMVADPWGLTSTAAVTMTVLPVNDAPRALGVIPHQSIEEGGASVTVDLTPYFDDPDGDSLAYGAESSDERAAAVTVAGATLTLVPVVAAAATVTVTASDAEGLTAAQTFGVTVGDRLVRGLLTDTLAAFSRAHLSSARLAIGRHLETGGGSPTRLMVAGRHLSLHAWREIGAGGLEQAHELLFRAATLRLSTRGHPAGAAAATPWSQRRGASRFMDDGLGGREQLLLGTDVLLSFGGNDRSMEAGGRGRWTFWVQGDRQWFRGSPAETAGYDGDLRTGYIGVDVRPSERFLAGVAVSRSGGGGSWEVGSSSGLLATELTVLHPYARWGNRDTAVWALAGLGRGIARNSRDLSGRIGQSPLSLGLGLVEGRQRLMATAGGLDVHLRGEASWARLRTGNGEKTVDKLEAAVRRLRTGVELALSMGNPESLTVSPFGAVSTRHDGGAGQTGVGLELAGGVHLRRGRVRIDAQGRMLALHSATSYEERGFSVLAAMGRGGYEPGLTASLRPHWGAAGHGAEALWRDHVQSYSRREDRPDRGVDARIGYGLRLPGGRLLTPFGGYGRMREAGRLQAGASLGMPGLFSDDPARPVQLEFTGERFHRLGAADYRFTVYGVFNFGRGR